MIGSTPEYYVRLRKHGAAVFHVDLETRTRRMELRQIAVVTKQGKIKPHGQHTLSDADIAAIRDWQAERRALETHPAPNDVQRTIDQINLMAAWVQKDATDPELVAATDPLLMAMHDLRRLLVKKQAKRARPDAPS